MTTDVARSIRRCRVPQRSVAVFWLGQAGFVFKTPEGRVVFVDPYLPDSVERLFGFRRIMAGVVAPPQAAARLRELGVEPRRIVEVREGAEAGRHISSISLIRLSFRALMSASARWTSAKG